MRAAVQLLQSQMANTFFCPAAKYYEDEVVVRIQCLPVVCHRMHYRYDRTILGAGLRVDPNATTTAGFLYSTVFLRNRCLLPALLLPNQICDYLPTQVLLPPTSTIRSAPSPFLYYHSLLLLLLCLRCRLKRIISLPLKPTVVLLPCHVYNAHAFITSN
jgi:hypothetical protein